MELILHTRSPHLYIFAIYLQSQMLFLFYHLEKRLHLLNADLIYLSYNEYHQIYLQAILSSQTRILNDVSCAFILSL
jgi:hypothetical protein